MTPRDPNMAEYLRELEYEESLSPEEFDEFLRAKERRPSAVETRKKQYEDAKRHYEENLF